MESPYTCRVCLEDDEIDNLIAPCGCNGTSLLIHKECLARCRRDINRRHHCQICLIRYDDPYDDDEVVDIIEEEEEEDTPTEPSCYHLFAFILYMVLLITTVVTIAIHGNVRNDEGDVHWYIMFLSAAIITFIFGGMLDATEDLVYLVVEERRYSLAMLYFFFSVCTLFIPMACYKVYSLCTN